MAVRRPLTVLAATGFLAAALAACGSKTDLKPPANQPAAVVPIGATSAPTTEELTTPDAQARPERSDELLKRSEQREPDDFDLPPTG